MFGIGKKTKYNVLPAIGHSYVMNEKTNEPLLTFLRPNSGLFCSTPLGDEKCGYFLNIRRPIVVDVLGVTAITIPDDLPPECDGIIFVNYGTYRIKAFYVKNLKTQVWRVDL